MRLQQYLEETYPAGKPIFSADIDIEGMTQTNLRQSLKVLTDRGVLKRFDRGVYYIPEKSVLKSGYVPLSAVPVVREKYLVRNGEACGYLSGIAFVNEIHLTTQVPAWKEIVTNNTSAVERRIVMPAGMRLILKKSRTEITTENYQTLQFLDLLDKVELYSEVQGEKLDRALAAYMRSAAINGDQIRQYIRLFPERVARVLIERGLAYVPA